MNLIRSSILSTVLFCGGLTILKAQTADELIKKHIAAIGGIKKWKSVKSIETSGRFHADGNSVVLYTTTILDHFGIRKDYTYEATGKSAYVILTTRAGWSYIPQTGLKVVPEPMPTQLVERNQYTLDIQGPLIDYKAKGTKISYEGKSTVQGTVCYKLKMLLASGVEEFVYLDVSNFYHVRTTQLIREHGKEEEEDLGKYSNFTKLPEGIVYPMTIDEGIGEQTVTSVKVNLPVDTAIFVPR